MHPFSLFTRPAAPAPLSAALAATPLYGLYHVFCAPGWEPMVAAQLARWQGSGLADATERLYISVIARDDYDVDRVRAIAGPRAEVIARNIDGTCYEFPALDFIHAKAQTDDFFFYYFHTKGISYRTAAAGHAPRRFRRFVAKIEAWREMMEYFLFDRWRDAVASLAAGADTYGCYLFPPGQQKMYAGNFWWAASRYFRTLPALTAAARRNRFLAEEWLLSRPGARAACAFHVRADLYEARISPALYAYDAFRVARAAATLRFWGEATWHKFLRRAFGINYKHRCQALYQHIDRKPAGTP